MLAIFKLISLRRMAALAWMLAPMAAAAASAHPLTLAAAERLALAGNAELAAARARARAMAEIPAQAGSLPDPVISIGALNLPVDSWSLKQENMTQLRIGVAQSIPFPGKLDLAREAAEQRAMAADEMVAERRLRLLRDVRLHWWRLWWLDKAIRLVRRNQALLRGLVRTAETRYATGKGLQQDVLLAQLELSNLSERERDLVAARRRTAASMNALIGRRADALIRIQENAETTPEAIQPPDSETLKRLARKRRPLLVALARKSEAAQHETALAEKDEWPDFRLDAGWGMRSGVNPASGRTRADLTSITLSVTLPLYADSKQDRRVAQRKAERAGAELDRQDAIWRVDAEIEAALASSEPGNQWHNQYEWL